MEIIDSSNLVVEAKAIREGIQYCLDKQFTNIIFETDYLAMINIINGV